MATRYGNGGGRGKRITDYEDQPMNGESSVSKEARHYSPEHRRQRRLGMEEAGLVAGGATATGFGARGIRNSTKGAQDFLKPPLKHAGKKMLYGSPKHVALVGGGLTAVTGAAALRQKAENRKMGIWR